VFFFFFLTEDEFFLIQIPDYSKHGFKVKVTADLANKLFFPCEILYIIKMFQRR